MLQARVIDLTRRLAAASSSTLSHGDTTLSHDTATVRANLFAALDALESRLAPPNPSTSDSDTE